MSTASQLQRTLVVKSSTSLISLSKWESFFTNFVNDASDLYKLILPASVVIIYARTPLNPALYLWLLSVHHTAVFGSVHSRTSRSVRSNDPTTSNKTNVKFGLLRVAGFLSLAQLRPVTPIHNNRLLSKLGCSSTRRRILVVLNSQEMGHFWKLIL